VRSLARFRCAKANTVWGRALLRSFAVIIKNKRRTKMCGAGATPQPSEGRLGLRPSQARGGASPRPTPQAGLRPAQPHRRGFAPPNPTPTGKIPTSSTTCSVPTNTLPCAYTATRFLWVRTKGATPHSGRRSRAHCHSTSCASPSWLPTASRTSASTSLVISILRLSRAAQYQGKRCRRSFSRTRLHLPRRRSGAEPSFNTRTSANRRSTKFNSSSAHLDFPCDHRHAQ